MSFKNSFKYCEALGCTYDHNIQYCCPELMPLCIPKTKLLNQIDKDLIKISDSNDVKDIEYIDRLVSQELQFGKKERKGL